MMLECLKRTFYGMLSSGVVYVILGSTEPLSLATKFGINYAYCVSEEVVKGIWDEDKTDLGNRFRINPAYKNLNCFRQEILNIDVQNLDFNTFDVGLTKNFLEKAISTVYSGVESKLDSYIDGVLKRYKYEDFSIKYDDYTIFSDYLSQAVVKRTFDAYLVKPLRKQIKSYFMEFAEELMPTTPKKVVEHKVMKEQITVNHLYSQPQGELTVKIVKLLARNSGKWMGYSTISRYAGCSIHWARTVVNKLAKSRKRFILGNWKTKPHRFYCTTSNANKLATYLYHNPPSS